MDAVTASTPQPTPGARLTPAARLRLIVILGALAAFAPLSVDMYLPAFPEMARDFGTSASHIQLTLTGCLVGLAVGQLLAGSLSDALGRKRPLLVGLAVYILASLACAFSPSVELLVVLRFVQGAAGAAGVVMSRAIVRDLFTGAPAARFFARLMVVSIAAPILAPTIGALVLHFTSWRAVFVVLAVIGFAGLAVSHVWLDESHPVELRRSGGFGQMLAGLRELVGHRAFMGYALASGLSLGAIFAYIAGSSFVLQDIYGLSPAVFALSFGANAVGIVLLGQISHYLVGRVPLRRLLLAGLTGLLVGAFAVLVVVLVDAGVAWFLTTLFLAVASIGLVIPNATPLALADHPHLAGSASALLGVAQFVVGAVSAPLVGLAGSGSAVPMAVVMASLGGCALVSVVLLTRENPASRATLVS